MNTDYAYCLGITCPIRDKCKRYLPESPDAPLGWVKPAYMEKGCLNFEQKGGEK